MSRHENTTPAIEDALNAAQVLFSANPVFLPPQSKHLYHLQARFWDEIETFSTGWFRRRQAATQAMIDAGRRIASDSGSDPALVIKEVTELQAGAMERLTADAKGCTEMLKHCADALARNEITAIQESAEKTKRATKTAKSDPV